MKFTLPRNPQPLGESLVKTRDESAQRKLYNTLTMLAYLLDVISRHHHFRERLAELIERYAINPASMGFPDDWLQRPTWLGRLS